MTFAETMLFQLRIIEIELAGWIEDPDIPHNTAKDMMDRLMAIRDITDTSGQGALLFPTGKG